MTKETKIEKELNASELPEQELENVAGGAGTTLPPPTPVAPPAQGKIVGSNSNIKNN